MAQHPDLIEAAEILLDEPMARRGIRMLKALAAHAPAGSKVTTHYEGRHRLLIMYGVGLPRRFIDMRRHVEIGGHVACWDMGYWDRDESMRMSIDSMHPTAAQLALAPAGECRRLFELREDADPNGPILLCGLGKKSAHMYGLQPLQWERKALRALRDTYPNRVIRWRPKGQQYSLLPSTVMWQHGTIEEAMRGCSLVVCRHSNVAIDACIAGVPVQCVDGAALALYSQTQTPTREQRAEFLRQVGFWNWSPAEAPQAWDWMKRVAAAAPSAV